MALATTLAITACSSKEESILEDAGKCGNIHFRSMPHVVSAQRIDGAGGDMLIQLVADIPNGEVQSFKDLSGLHNFAPGVPEALAENYWKGSGLAETVKTNGSAGGEHEENEGGGSAGKWVVIRAKDDGESRVYIRLAC
ncbi:hypothetical protein [Segniliparus rotundus]|uniref:hypothetical protein n=1 Tax=Segniliparus rotundus TaxID=286802 RepID=UPI0002EE3944|nr:hypothetical protein [Segniliparus rotundus]